MTTLSVVIPAYNEEKSIADICHRVLSAAPGLVEVGVDNLELWVVDDGSQDKTVEIVKTIPAVQLICHASNQGYGAALKTGFANAQGELIGFLDADGTYPPEYFPLLCQAALNGAELVIGSRMAGERSQMPLTRRLGNLFFAGLLTLISRQRVSDSASGMRVFHRSILNHIYPLPNGLNLTPVMSTRAIHEGIRLVEIAIPYHERSGRSKLSVVRDGGIFLQSILWTALTYNPVRILGLLGIAGLGFTLLVGLAFVAARASGITSLNPLAVTALYSALVAALAGVNLFALGITFNYLVSLFYKKPIRQGLFGKPLFKTPLDRQFGWMGLVSMLLGTLVALVSLVLGWTGWEISRLWIYLTGAALIFLVGLQLVVYYILLRVLDELSQRENLTSHDLNEKE